jgi:hypothetical protein
MSQVRALLCTRYWRSTSGPHQRSGTSARVVNPNDGMPASMIGKSSPYRHGSLLVAAGSAEPSERRRHQGYK